MSLWTYIKSLYQYIYYRIHRDPEDSLITIIETEFESYEEDLSDDL